MSKGRIRDKKLEFYVTESERELIDKKVAESNLDRSKYLRKAAMGEPIVNLDLSKLDGVIAELNAIGHNINQIAKICNTTNSVSLEDVKELKEKMNEVCEIIAHSF